jgi:hypothetical protein
VKPSKQIEQILNTTPNNRRTTMIVMNAEDTKMQIVWNQSVPEDLKRRVVDGRLDEDAAIRIARRRHIESVLWELARRAGIAEDLERQLA